jgi:hypothetical protein
VALTGTAVPLVAVVLEDHPGIRVGEVGAGDLLAAVPDRVLARRSSETGGDEDVLGPHLPPAVGGAQIVAGDEVAQILGTSPAGAEQRLGPPPQLADGEQSPPQRGLDRDLQRARVDHAGQVDRRS